MYSAEGACAPNASGAMDDDGRGGLVEVDHFEQAAESDGVVWRQVVGPFDVLVVVDSAGLAQAVVLQGEFPEGDAWQGLGSGRRFLVDDCEERCAVGSHDGFGMAVVPVLVALGTIPLFDPSEHDNDLAAFGPHHGPELSDGFFHAALAGNVGFGARQARDVAGVDVVRPEHSFVFGC